jgi:diketogulonate reductase-like aldo/keto reductase
VVAYSPFGHDDFPNAGAQGRLLAEIASRLSATPRQVALAFLTRGKGVLAIPKAAQATHVDENAGAGRVVLSADDVTRLDKAFPLGPKGRGLPML